MSHISLTYHIVWRTKRSQRTITEEHERDLYAYLFEPTLKSKVCLKYLYFTKNNP